MFEDNKFLTYKDIQNEPERYLLYLDFFMLSELIDLNLGVNLHPVRFDIGTDHRPDATYIQFLILVNFKL